MMQYWGEALDSSSGGVGGAVSSIPVVSSLFFLSQKLHCEFGGFWYEFWMVASEWEWYERMGWRGFI
jgi:hypothetical protein